MTSLDIVVLVLVLIALVVSAVIIIWDPRP